MSLYALFYLGSFFVFVALSTILLKTRRLNGKLRNTFALVYLIGMMFGAHAFYYALCEHTLVNEPIREFYSSLPNRQGGLLANLSGLRAATAGAGGLWGGPLFAIMTLVLSVVFLKLSIQTKRDLLDVFAVSFPYALALAKAGCFVNGCCYGVEGSGPLYIRFTWVPEDNPCYLRSCFPTQLLDLLIYLSLATALLVLFKKSSQSGRLILWFVLLYSTGRFLSEFTRGDNVGGKLHGLSPVQVVLVGSFVASAVLLLKSRLFNRVLSLQLMRRSNQTAAVRASATTDKSIEKLDRYMLATAVIILLALFAFPILALPLLFLGVLALVRLYPVLKSGGNAVQWSRVFNACACFALDLLFVAVFLMTNFMAFFVGFALFIAISVLILNSFFESVAQQKQSQEHKTAFP